MESPPPSGDSGADNRLSTLLRVASLHRTALSLEEIGVLLPDEAPVEPSEIAQWVARTPGMGRVVGGFVTTPHDPDPSPDLAAERRARGEAFWESAQGLFRGPLAPVAQILKCAGITGSAAYREPLEGDDIDLMAITRAGTTWLFLTLAFARLRLGGAARAPLGTHWCLNYVIDERRAAADFARPQGYLFAREALSARMILGSEYYRNLLLLAPWMEGDLPRLYRQSTFGERGQAPKSERAGPLVGLANALLFPIVAAYLQLVGLFRNQRLRRQGREAECFRTITRPHGFELHTRHFDALSAVYANSLSGGSEAPA